MREYAKFNMKKLLFIITLIFSTSVFAVDYPGKQQEFLSPDEAFKMSISDLGNKEIQISWDIEEGYYLYMGMFEFSINQDNVKILNVAMPDGLKKKDEFFGDVDVYYQSTYARLAFDNINKNTNLTITYQGCADAGLCYPPIKKTISLKEYSLDQSGLIKTGSTNSCLLYTSPSPRYS